MRRILTTALLALTVGALFVFGSGAEDDSSGGYEIRAAFDNGSFLVPGEVVRVAGADVGVIESTEVSREDEIIALDPEPHAGAGQGDRRHEDHRPGLPGLPRGRLLHHPARSRSSASASSTARRPSRARRAPSRRPS